MRFVTRTLAFVLVILAAFWFTAENAAELVNVDLAFVRIRASLPLVIFVSVLAGMGASTFLGWRADRASRRRASAEAQRLSSIDPLYGVDLETSRHEDVEHVEYR